VFRQLGLVYEREGAVLLAREEGTDLSHRVLHSCCDVPLFFPLFGPINVTGQESAHGDPPLS
jgi:hypothetical protein